MTETANISYYTALDNYPQEYEDSTMLYKFYDYLRKDKLATTKCKDCGKIHWPPRIICPDCISDNLEWEEVPPNAKIYSFTVQYAGLPPEFSNKAPIVYALLDFDNGIRLLSAIIDANEEELATGLYVELAKGTVAPDYEGRERIIPYFRLKK